MTQTVGYSTFQVGSFVHKKAFVLVNGEAQERVEYIFERLSLFIVRVHPIIEDVCHRIKKLDDTTYKNLHRENIEAEWRDDLASVKKGLADYEETLGFMNNHVREMEPDFGLELFLAENGINNAEIAQFRREVGEYWKDTYGIIFSQLVEIKNTLKILRGQLKKQLDLLEKMEATTYFQGFAEMEETNQYFEKERAAFRKLIGLVTAASNNTTISRLKSSLSNKKRAAKIALNQLLKHKMKLLRNERGEIGVATAAIMAVVLAMGALSFVLAFKKNLIKKGLTITIGRYLDKTNRARLMMTSQTLIGEVEELATIKSVWALERVAYQILREL